MLLIFSTLLQGMFVGTVEVGGMRYSGTPSSTKAEAQQIAASVANSALPPVHVRA